VLGVQLQDELITAACGDVVVLRRETLESVTHFTLSHIVDVKCSRGTAVCAGLDEIHLLDVAQERTVQTAVLCSGVRRVAVRNDMIATAEHTLTAGATPGMCACIAVVLSLI